MPKERLLRCQQEDRAKGLLESHIQQLKVYFTQCELLCLCAVIGASQRNGQSRSNVDAAVGRQHIGLAVRVKRPWSEEALKLLSYSCTLTRQLYLLLLAKQLILLCLVSLQTSMTWPTPSSCGSGEHTRHTPQQWR